MNATASKVLNTWASVISQTYTGDINILPANRSFNPTRLLSYRSKEEIIALMKNGEQSTWPKIEMIRNQTKIGRTLDGILERFEESIVHSVQESEERLLKVAGE